MTAPAAVTFVTSVTSALVSIVPNFVSNAVVYDAVVAAKIAEYA